MCSVSGVQGSLFLGVGVYLYFPIILCGVIPASALVVTIVRDNERNTIEREIRNIRVHIYWTSGAMSNCLLKLFYTTTYTEQDDESKTWTKKSTSTLVLLAAAAFQETEITVFTTHTRVCALLF